jgi:hypothetical protein
MSEILSAATVTTGAKMIQITPFMLRYLSIPFISINFLKLALMMINGEATIYSQSIHTLAISTSASASRGKNKATAVSALMIKIPDVHHADQIFASLSCEKLSKEEYIVTNGPTNHLDLLIRPSIVSASLQLKSAAPVSKIPLFHEPR